MTGSEKTFDLATGQCLNLRVARGVVTATVLAPYHTQMYPTGQVRCLADRVRSLDTSPRRVYFDNAFLDAMPEEAEAIVAFVREANA